MKHIQSISFSAVALLIFGGCSLSPSVPCPTDQVLINRFNSNTALFENLASNPENKALLATLEIERVIARPGNTKRIWFEVWFKDFPGPGGCMKGYAYCEEIPKDVVDSIDKNSEPGSAEVKEIYRKISGPWYLFYQSAN